MSRQQIPALMREAGLNAAVAFSMENMYYSSGTMLLTQRMIPTRLAMTMWYADGSATILVCSIEVAQVKAESWIKDVRTYTEFKDSPLVELAKILKEKGLSSGRIGLENRYLAAAYYRELAAELPQAQLVDADDIFETARMIKSAEEVDLLRRAASSTEKAIRKAFEGAHLGTTEASMSETMGDDILQHGADGVAFVVMTTGENSKLVHPTPSQTQIRSGDIVRTDFGGHYGSYFGGYYSDIARTAVAGKPTPRQRDMYKHLFEIHDRILREVKPGTRPCDLYQLCKTEAERRKVDFHSPHIGHNMGVFIHEKPMLNPQTTLELQPGMVLAIEPVLVDDGFIYHIEDELVVTEKGHELLTRAYDWSELMTID